jgi:HEAT repeat protein
MNTKHAEETAAKTWNKPTILMGIGTVGLIALVGVLFLTLGRGKSVAALAAELQSPDTHTRHLAARQLAKLGSQAKDAVSQLTHALQDSDKSVRHYAAKTLAEVGIDARPATDALIADLADPDPETRYYVVKALSKVELDQAHAGAVRALVKTLKDENPKTRYYSAKVLKGMGPAARAAVPALREASNDADKDVKETAAIALKKITKTN